MQALLQEAASRLHAIEDRLTVRTQIAAAVAAMSIALVSTLAAGAAIISYRHTAALIESSVAGIASSTSARLDRFMATRRQEMKLFTELEPMQRLWQGDPTELRSALEALQRNFDFTWIGFADLNGNVVASTGGLLQGKSVAARPWFKQGLENVVVGDVHEALLLASLLTQRANNEPYRFVDIALPVRDTSGKVIGVLGGHLDWTWASNLIADVQANDGNTDTRLSILSKGGMVLVGPKRETIRYGGDELADMLKVRDGTFRETVDGQQMLTAFHVGNGYRDYQGLNWIVTAS
ncbi:cache domain-containing protein [Bradyrhizobium sp. DASA03076]|uniref:cache domain-containing protein n=1 Tax=Bradyrhizobium sp. BLXBL-03 TaxID=3395916 RepID=UPI003F6EFFB1